MQMNRLIMVFTIIFFSIGLLNNAFCRTDESFIKVNQLGYLQKDVKSAIISSNSDLNGKKFLVRDLHDKKNVFTGEIGPTVPGVNQQSSFLFNHIVDFSVIEARGSYRVELEDKTSSYAFEIRDDVYRGIIDNLLVFLRAQRCGNTKPELHKPCHLYDATNIDLDLTGGWHDAGDFLKFTRSESYTTYTLLLSYEINKEKYLKYFSDLNNNGIADVLDEARIGLNYLVKVYPDEMTFVSTVGDFKADHSQGVRMPEDDKLFKTNRPALIRFQRYELGQYAFTMALASKIFRDIPLYSNDADIYLILAKRAYDKAKGVETGEYDKLCLAATELYNATQEEDYLSEAKRFNDQLSTSDMGNWFDNTNLAHARLGSFYTKAAEKLRRSVSLFHKSSNTHLFGYDVKYIWSGLYVAISSATAGWFYKSLTNDDSHDALIRRIRDYLLGVNPWGICFISGLGTQYPQNIHNNVAVYLNKNGILKNGAITGAIPGGPLSRNKWEAKWSNLVPKGGDIYAKFQPPDCVYYDYFKAFPTNEPCIYGSSEAILFFSFYLRYLSDSTR
jgi:hypothetical protein